MSRSGHAVAHENDKLEVSTRPTWAHVTVVGKEILIRDLKGMTSYRWD